MSKAATADSYSKNMLHQKVFRTIICILFCIIALLPFVLLVMNATRDSESIKAGVSLIPSTHLIENWKNLMIKQNGMQITLQKAIINSATITIPGTFLSVYFSSLTAYGIHVYDFKFKKFAWASLCSLPWTRKSVRTMSANCSSTEYEKDSNKTIFVIFILY